MASPRGGRSSSGSSNSESSLVLLLAVAIVSFFAGTVLTAHIHLGSCLVGGGSGGDFNNQNGDSSGNNHHQWDAKVEELAQKRLLGAFVRAFVRLFEKRSM